MDIVEDATMKKNQCIIESDTGVYDCSLDIELNNLIKDIKLVKLPVKYIQAMFYDNYMAGQSGILLSRYREEEDLSATEYRISIML